ncbi:MAG: DUF3048 C-terminal domain-containing protein, partial [Anaerovoracaceae bacterium]
KIPDNCYTDGEKVWTQIKALDMDKEKKPRTFPFLKGKPDSALPEATEIDVNYVSASNHYVYNPETKLYARSLYGEPFIDKETGNQLNVANVIVQTVTIDRVDEAQRLFLAMTKGGECAVFTQGKVIEGTWTKEDEEAPTIFKDKNGKEIELTPGVTFIQLIDYTVKFAYQ